MSHPAITLYELASPRYAILLRDAAEWRVDQRREELARSARPSWLPGMFHAIAAAFHRQPSVTAAR